MATGIDMIFIASLFLGYLLGSVPFGLVLTRLAGLGDIRKMGSGNIGATNVLRTGNKPLALATLLLDAGKGAIAFGIALLLAPEAAILAGAAAFIGHLYPIYLGFKGGKGVATFLGLMLAVSWPVGLACCVTWLLVALIFRFSSLAGLMAAATAPLYAWIFGPEALIIMAFALAVAVTIRHEANIRRLIAGTEPRIGRKEKADS